MEGMKRGIEREYGPIIPLREAVIPPETFLIPKSYSLCPIAQLV